MSKKRLLIFGMGQQGQGAFQDAHRTGYFTEITVADFGEAFEQQKVSYTAQGAKAISLDASNLNAVREVIKEHDIIIELLPLAFAKDVGRIAAECGVSLVNSMYYIGQSMNDPVKFQQAKDEIEEINTIAKNNDCTLLTAFGMDPGLDLIMCEEIVRDLDEIDTFYSYGGGFPAPAFANNPLRYKFSWAPHSTLLSYYRSIKRIVNGEIVTVSPDKLFSEENIHILHDKDLGYDIECYSTGNCENFAQMFGILGKVQHMDRFSCRLPGHCNFWHKVVNCGFLRSEPVMVQGAPVIPLEFVSALLQSQEQFWFKKEEQDVCFIRAEVKGKKNGKNIHRVYTIIDHKDLKTGLTAMQRTVGYTVSIAAQLILEGKISKRGVLLPMDVPLETVEAELAKRNIIIHKYCP